MYSIHIFEYGFEKFILISETKLPQTSSNWGKTVVVEQSSGRCVFGDTVLRYLQKMADQLTDSMEAVSLDSTPLDYQYMRSLQLFNDEQIL